MGQSGWLVAGSLAAQDSCCPLVGNWGSASCQPGYCLHSPGITKPHRSPPRPPAAPTTCTAAPRTLCVTWSRISVSLKRTLRTSSPSCQHTQVSEAGPRPSHLHQEELVSRLPQEYPWGWGTDGHMEGPGQVQPPLLHNGPCLRITARGGLPSLPLVTAVEPDRGGHPRGSPVPLLTCPPCLTHSAGGEV